MKKVAVMIADGTEEIEGKIYQGWFIVPSGCECGI